MLKERVKFLVSIFTGGVIIGALTTVVMAATAESNFRTYGPINGYFYENQAIVSNDSSLSASTRVGNDSTAIPTGYMGARAELYKGGTLCSGNSWIYNAATQYWLTSTVVSSCGSGAYYSKGWSAAYNGNGYDQFYTNQSPNINE